VGRIRRRGSDGRGKSFRVLRGEVAVAQPTNEVSELALTICVLSDEDLWNAQHGDALHCADHEHVSRIDADLRCQSDLGRPCDWVTADWQRSRMFAGTNGIALPRLKSMRDLWHQRKSYSPNGAIGMVTVQIVRSSR
jgi:hypothetical protein